MQKAKNRQSLPTTSNTRFDTKSLAPKGTKDKLVELGPEKFPEWK